MRNLRYLLGASGLVMIMVGCSPKAPQAVPAPVAPVAVAAPAPPVNVPPAAFKPVRPTAGYRPEWIDNQKSVPGIAGVGQRKRNAMGDVMLQRKLLYTAVTRAQEKVILVGMRKAFWMAVGNAREVERRTNLPRLLASLDPLPEITTVPQTLADEFDDL